MSSILNNIGSNWEIWIVGTSLISGLAAIGRQLTKIVLKGLEISKQDDYERWQYLKQDNEKQWQYRLEAQRLAAAETSVAPGDSLAMEDSGTITVSRGTSSQANSSNTPGQLIPLQGPKERQNPTKQAKRVNGRSRQAAKSVPTESPTAIPEPPRPSELTSHSSGQGSSQEKKGSSRHRRRRRRRR
jgi:hypothetical protein